MKLARPSRRFKVSIFLLPLPPFRMANLCMDFNSRLDTESRDINSYKEQSRISILLKATLSFAN